MNSYIYQYRVFEDGDDDGYEFSSYVHLNMPYERIAEAAAEDYFHEHDGWESNWPRNFEIKYKGELLGCFKVDMEAKPEFAATREDP